MLRTPHLHRVLLLLLLPIVVGSTACGVAPPAAPEPSTIRVGLLVPLSGDFAELVGNASVRGSELAVQEINTAGGLKVGNRSYLVELVIADDQDTPQVAVDEARRLIVQEHVVALLGVPLSRIAIPVAGVAESEQIPMITTWSSSPATTKDRTFVFRVIFVDTLQGEILARFAYEEMGARQAAVLYDAASAYNNDIAHIFRDKFQAAGGKVVAFESYATGEQDWSAQLARIKANKPDVLFLPNYENEVPQQVEQAHAQGIDAALLGSDSWSNMTPDQHALLEGAYYSTPWSPDIAREQTEHFMHAYYDAYGEVPDVIGALAYDATGLLFEAIARSTTVEPRAIRDSLASIEEYAGVTGTMLYDGSGDPRRSVVIVQIEHGTPTFHSLVNP